MGQNASKVAWRLLLRVGSAWKQRTSDSAPPSASRFTDPNATEGGFRRGQGPVNPKDEMQRKFLEQKAGAQEMPEDLLSFSKMLDP